MPGSTARAWRVFAWPERPVVGYTATRGASLRPARQPRDAVGPPATRLETVYCESFLPRRWPFPSSRRFYLPVLLRRSVAARLGIAIGIGGIIGIAAIGALAPTLTSATPPSSPAPVASAAFGPSLRTDVAPGAGVAISFSRPMDPATVAAAISVTPASSISLDWDAAGTLVTVRPRVSWALDTLYTITVGAIAADRQAHTLGGPLRTTFVTRPATTGSILATVVNGQDADVSTGFELRFDRAVDVAAAEAAFTIEPTVAGTFQPADGTPTADSIVFTPMSALTAGATYRVSLARSIADADGAATSPPVALSVRTALGPKVVRFRPRNGTTDVAVGARLSVRFTQADGSGRDRGRIQRDGERESRSTGKIAWAENDRSSSSRRRRRCPRARRSR